VQTRQAMLPDEINDACFVDVKNHKEVFESLKSNVKVSFDGQRFAFKVTIFLVLQSLF
jgi:transcription initiation factor TFIIE subunit beta